MEKQTKTSKKRMLLYSIIALTIGMATILPLSYLTLTNATAQTQPFFNPYISHIIAIPYVESLYSEPYITTVWPDGSYSYSEIPDEGSITAVMCYDITSNGANLKDVDAKIEVYNFHFFSEKGSILNMTQSIAIAGTVSDPSSSNGIISAIAEWDSDKNTYTFADGTVYDFTKVLGYVEESVVGYESVEMSTAVKGHHLFGGGPVLSESNGEKTAQALLDLRSAQTIYVDITRILQVTYKHPNSPTASSVITATPTINEVLYHITLSELDNMGRAVYDPDPDAFDADHGKYRAIWVGNVNQQD
jgi:hypothetical protein